MRCLYCDEEIKNYTLYSLLFEEDKLCEKCRKKMKFKHLKFNSEGLEVESFYEYDSLFRDILLQYKECNDEALKEIFLYKIRDYLQIKYLGYKILYVPSTKRKLEDRGFNHLKLMCEPLNFKEVKGLKMIEEISQIQKNLDERLKMKQNYIYEGKDENKVLIVDDLYTTGSSLLGVYFAIKPHCDKVKAVVFGKR